MEIGETLLVHSRQEWRDWLAQHHHDYKEICVLPLAVQKVPGRNPIVGALRGCCVRAV